MKYILFTTGFILSVIGLSFIVIYLNLLVMGYSFLDYVKYIFCKIECLIFFVGYLIVLIMLKGKKK